MYTVSIILLSVYISIIHVLLAISGTTYTNKHNYSNTHELCLHKSLLKMPGHACKSKILAWWTTELMMTIPVISLLTIIKYYIFYKRGFHHHSLVIVLIICTTSFNFLLTNPVKYFSCVQWEGHVGEITCRTYIWPYSDVFLL